MTTVLHPPDGDEQCEALAPFGPVMKLEDVVEACGSGQWPSIAWTLGFRRIMSREWPSPTRHRRTLGLLSLVRDGSPRSCGWH